MKDLSPETLRRPFSLLELRPSLFQEGLDAFLGSGRNMQEEDQIKPLSD
jgi:hypothetical protein